MSNERYRLYGYRWVVLAAFMFINLTIQMFWIAYAPITGPAARFYGVTDLQIGLLAMSFMIAFIPLSIPVSWVIDTYGFRPAVSIGAVLMGVFGVARGFAGDNYPLVLWSTIGIAAAQPFLLNAWTKVPANWFAIEERATAVGLVTLANLLGTALGMVLTPALTADDAHPDRAIGLRGLGGILRRAVHRALPRETAHGALSARHGSARADARRAETCPQSQGLLAVPAGRVHRHGDFQRRHHLGGEHHPPARLHPHGRRDARRPDAGRGRPGRGGHPAFLGQAAQAQALFVARFCPGHPRVARPDLCRLLLGCSWSPAFVLGFFLVSAIPVGMQYAAEIAHPTPEGTSNGLIQLFGQASVVFVYIMEALKGKGGSFTPALLLAAGLMILSVLVITRMKEPQTDATRQG